MSLVSGIIPRPWHCVPCDKLVRNDDRVFRVIEIYVQTCKHYIKVSRVRNLLLAILKLIADAWMRGDRLAWKASCECRQATYTGWSQIRHKISIIRDCTPAHIMPTNLPAWRYSLTKDWIGALLEIVAEPFAPPGTTSRSYLSCIEIASAGVISHDFVAATDRRRCR